MSEERALEVVDVEATYVPTLAISVDQAVEQYEAFQRFKSRVLKEGVDYGTIPGTDKPSLWKPGAEKLCNAFALSAELVLTDKVEMWEEGFFYYEYECRLIHRRTGSLVATCHGSANSREGRYRWRYLTESKATAEDKARAVRTETRNGKYGEYTVYVVENDDPYTLVNTFQKMAQKRAFVGAVLLATNASDSFTQDLEDMDEFVSSEPERPKSSGQTRKARAEKAGNGPLWAPADVNKFKAEIGPKHRSLSLGEAASLLGLEESKLFTPEGLFGLGSVDEVLKKLDDAINDIVDGEGQATLFGNE